VIVTVRMECVLILHCSDARAGARTQSIKMQTDPWILFAESFGHDADFFPVLIS
jgi:hypothetical protein